MLPARKTIGDNIKAIAQKRGMSLADVATRAGISRRVLGKVTAGRENYRIDIFESIANGLRVPGWQLLADPENERARVDHVRDSRNGYGFPPAGMSRIQHLDIEASAGDGAAAIDHAEIIDHLDISTTWMRQVLGVANAELIRVIGARGDSMSPTINNADLVFVDISQKTFTADAIYALLWRNDLMIKRLQAGKDDTIHIASDNPAYPPQIAGADNEHELTICGRVVGWWTLRRY